jgi:hypothetical protein
MGKEKAMEPQEDTSRRVMSEAITTRVGAVALPLGTVLLAVSEAFHPSGEDPMDHSAVFREYAESDAWTIVHLGQYFGFLLVLGGLVALYYSLAARPGRAAGLAPFGLAAAVTAAASYTVLQAVDGIALKRAVDAFAAAEAIRWTEIGMNSLSNFLTGLTLLLFGLVVAFGRSYPRWTGWMAVASGCAFVYNGVVEVAYEGFVPSIVKLLGLALLALWTFVMAFLMWREAGRRYFSNPESAQSGTAHTLPPRSRTAVRRSG